MGVPDVVFLAAFVFTVALGVLRCRLKVGTAWDFRPCFFLSFAAVCVVFLVISCYFLKHRQRVVLPTRLSAIAVCGNRVAAALPRSLFVSVHFQAFFTRGGNVKN